MSLPRPARPFAVFGLLLAAACLDAPVGVEPGEPIELDLPSAEAAAWTTEVDGFHFLPPIGQPDRSGRALLNEILPLLTVDVCPWTGTECGAPVASFDAAGDGDGAIRIQGDAFRVVWDTRASALEAGGTYRLRVRVGPWVMGWVDVHVVDGGRGKAAKGSDALVVQRGRSIPIAFRVGRSAFWDGLDASLSFAGAAPVPGAVGALEGVSVAPSGQVAVTVQGRPAPAVLSGGTLLVALPLFVGPDGWPAPPADPADVMVFENGVPVAWARGAVAVAPMPDAPGSGLRAQDAMRGAAAALDRLAVQAAPDSEDEAWAFAAAAALGALADSDDARSLGGVLATADPATRRLVDAWLASSGVLELLERYAEGLAVVAGAPATTPGSGGRAAPLAMPEAIPSALLAERMQLYEVVKLLGEVVIAETSSEFGTYVGLAAGALGLVEVPAVAAAGIVGGILAVADFVTNKLLVGLLPATVDDLTLSLASTTLAPGQETIADVRVAASNAPPGIGIQDIVSQTLAVLGPFAGGGPAQSFEDVLVGVANFFLGVMQSALAAYSAEHPELNLDLSVTSVPDLAWEASVFDPALAEPLTLTPEVIAPVPGALQWRASDDVFGQGRIFVRTGTGPDAILLDLPPGIDYTGGAFGNDVVQSDPVLVEVVGDLTLEVDFAETIAVDGINVLEARTGYLDASGDPVWTGGIDIELVLDGGVAQSTQGVSDADGRFITLVQLAPSSDQVIVSVTATDAAGQSVTRTVEAEVEADAPAFVIPRRNSTRSFVSPMSARAQAPGGLSNTDQAAPGMFDFGDYSASVSANDAGTYAGGSTSAGATASQARSYELDPATGRVSALTFSGSASGDASGDNRNCCIPAQGTATVPMQLQFSVPDGPVDVEVRVTCTLAGGDDRSPSLSVSLGSIRLQTRDDASVCSGGEGVYTGTLAPGTWTLDVRAVAAATVPGNSSGGNSGSVDFQVEVRFGG
ncbi:MAG: hypothetical protein RJQ04_08020 [Longimicrobiales bacterium]